ncbi:hypothetical protein LTR62_006091 [Meristemomyces frigidus]|uniref:3-carboxymuconate cyclase n=1 Tax=Meristemomyces frigidus TaxID=1508187 RepID=A0AAN7YQ78_9PEZI|nr:hypothetical protein LTR62_006091 [Meristemomyces frigidus]
MRLSLLPLLPFAAVALAQVPEFHPHGPPPGSWGQGWGWGSGYANKAIYFLENNPSGSSIVSMKISTNGSISNPKRTATGGVGSITLNSTGQPVAADSFQSQSSVFVSGDYLFTVNAGSDTVSMFRIDPHDATNIMLVGSPAGSGGQFPNSVTYSRALNTACVLNGGAKAGVMCYHVDRQLGLIPTGSFIQFSKSISNETTPPTGPPESSSQIFFNPTSTVLLVDQKGSKPGSGHIVTYPIVNGAVTAAEQIDNQFPNIALPFAAVFLDDTRAFIVDPSCGASIFTVPASGHLVQDTHVTIPTQLAVCWANYDARLNTAYAIDVAQALLFTFDATTGALTGSFGPDAIYGGLFDSVISNGLMYSLTATDGVVVLDLASKGTRQYFDLTGFGVRQFWTGMAVSS